MLDATNPATDAALPTSRLLADHTTLRIGGPAAELIWADAEADVVAAVTEADKAATPVLVLGGGSNLVVADEGFAGRVVRVANPGLTFVKGAETVVLTVGAGERWDDVVLASLDAGLVGLESLSGIPGLAGATPIQNVGAYGTEIASLLHAVRVFDRDQVRHVTLAADQCGFGYRTSALKGADRYVVLGIEIALGAGVLSAPVRYQELAAELGIELGGRAPALDVRAAVLALRASKGMLIDPGDPDSVSVGSFFTNPVLAASALPVGAPSWPAGDQVKTSAAWLIEQAGFARGYGDGRVGLSTKHTLALVNRGGASASELMALARTVRDGVRDRFGVTLDVEPALVGVAL